MNTLDTKYSVHKIVMRNPATTVHKECVYLISDVIKYPLKSAIQTLDFEMSRICPFRSHWETGSYVHIINDTGLETSQIIRTRMTAHKKEVFFSGDHLHPLQKMVQKWKFREILFSFSKTFSKDSKNGTARK